MAIFRCRGQEACQKIQVVELMSVEGGWDEGYLCKLKKDLETTEQVRVSNGLAKTTEMNSLTSLSCRAEISGEMKETRLRDASPGMQGGPALPGR
jgi:hypothetical protein